MRFMRIVAATAFSLLLSGLSQAADMSAQVRGQLQAYNRGDLAQYAAYFHEDIAVYNYPEEPITAGKNALVRSARRTFREREPRAEIVELMSLNDKVITLEDTSYKIRETRRSTQVIKIYQFQDGKIRRMTFMN